ncbi:DUF4132 domain-containing protein [Rudaea sp. 3F27F6]|uniref:DUF4132 domain-containing protein n=1 Tax=Rudaea sp. 3F27F6 TaxID=2502208 RepID=UPI001BB2A262|nr:DUF4132 domain-containing protein [Rudaea sp. 3F27F6]
MNKLIRAVAGQSTGAGSDEKLDKRLVGALKQALESFDKVKPSLSQKALAFVLYGSYEDVLIGVQNADLNELLGRPGRLRWNFHNHNDKDAAAIAKKSMAARSEFYERIDVQNPPLDVLVRLGKLFASIDNGKSLDHPGAPTPPWLQYLINDAIFASFNDHNAPKDLDKKRPAWTIDLIANLLAHEGLDETIALQEVFERKDLDGYYHNRLEALVRAPQVGDFMLAHRDAVAALRTQLSVSGRIELTRRIGRDKPLLNEFVPLFVELAVDSGKTVRTEAALYFEGIVEPQRLERLGALLSSGDTGQRAQAAEILARQPAEAARNLLEIARSQEQSKAVQESIRGALARLDAAGDADAIELPAPPTWEPFEDQPLGDEAFHILVASRAELTEKARVAAEEEAARNARPDTKYKYNWAASNLESLKKTGDEDLRVALRVLNGQATQADLEALGRRNKLLNIVPHGQKLQALPAFGVPHLARWIASTRRWGTFWDDDGFQKWLARQAPNSVDLRALAAVFERSDQPLRHVANACLMERYRQASTPIDVLAADRVWPFFAEHPEFIDEGLGLAPSQADVEGYRRTGFDIGHTLRTLTVFPTVPSRWLPRLMEIALGEGKTHRADAQRALSSLPDIGKRVVDSLMHTKSEIRIEAANWLADLKYRDAIPALTKALDKESRETVRAALLTTLEALGDDISSRLTPAVLLSEAKKGLKGKAPIGLAWFSLDLLPTCKWMDGEPVDPAIVQWWVVLACKLKEPAGNALLMRYMGLLDSASVQKVGSLVLRLFIAQDTRHPTLEDGIAFAQANAPSRYQNYQTWYKNAKPEHRQYYEANFNKTPEQVFEECKREKMGEYLGSAIGEKGVLALTAFAPAHEAVTLLQQFMRDHYPRRAQIEAMLEGVAAGNDPLVIQLLLGLSRRYRTASVKDRARALVQEIAERNGWTQEQLADRTIPTAGLNDAGKLELQYGERVFTVTLDTALKSELRNPEGKAVKALPEARQNDDAALIKEAKTEFSTHKKELKQVIELQTARLFEAMCTGRLWPQDEWREYLHRHPIVGRLIQRLVWLEVDIDGKVQRSFRPTEDGSLLDTSDDEIELQHGMLLRLGHASLVDDRTAAAWTKHFKDYKLIPLFAQMSRKIPAVEYKDCNGVDVTEISDRLGWISDTFTVRGVLTKLGYQRAQAEDGGFFNQYLKEFSTAGVRIAIEFSGNSLPEENVPAALKALSFENIKVRGWSDRAFPLERVPPVLLAEGYADYLATAQACVGFDPDWEKKMPW